MVKIYLSFFSLAKVIQLAKRIDKSLFSSIVSPWDDPERVESTVWSIKLHLSQLCRRYMPWLPTILLQQGMTWAPTWKALPTAGLVSQVLTQRLKKSVEVARVRSIFLSLPYDQRYF